MGGGRGPCVSTPKASLAGDAHVGEKSASDEDGPPPDPEEWIRARPKARSRWKDAKVKLAAQQAVRTAVAKPVGKGPTGKLMERLATNPETTVRGSTDRARDISSERIDDSRTRGTNQPPRRHAIRP